MKKLFQKILAALARKIVKKYQPDVIAITGSAGKTTAKEAIVRVLSGTFRVRGNEKSYNNEVGVPLTIIGCHTPGRSLVMWVRVFLRAFALLARKEKDYPSILVLEMGADAPGDIERLISIAQPRISVITAIGPAHLEKLGTIERLVEEKMKIFSRHTRSDQWIVFNADDPHLSFEKTEKTAPAPVSVLTFGTSEVADIRISDISERYIFHPDFVSAAAKLSQTAFPVPDPLVLVGIACTLTYNGTSVRAEFPRLVGRHTLQSVIAGATVGCIYKIPLTEIARRLHTAEPAPGRMHLIPGIKTTLIIDDTYNSSPSAARGALDVLMSFEIDGDARRIAVLGDMRELGEHTEKEHRTLGAYVAEKGIDYLFVVGQNAKFLAEGAQNLDSSRIFVFNDSMSVGRALQDFMQKGDVILIKGSQNIIRLERAVKEIMAEPHRASELLVRQEKEWT